MSWECSTNDVEEECIYIIRGLSCERLVSRFVECV
jgi:hypothetical protein